MQSWRVCICRWTDQGCAVRTTCMLSGLESVRKAHGARNSLLHHRGYHLWHLSMCLTPNSSYPGLQFVPAKCLRVQVFGSQVSSWTWLRYPGKPVLNCGPGMRCFAPNWTPSVMLLIRKYVTATYMSFLLVFLLSRLQQWYPQQHWLQVRGMVLLLWNSFCFSSM